MPNSNPDSHSIDYPLLDNQFVQLWAEDDILYCIYKPINITLEVAKTLGSIRDQYMQEQGLQHVLLLADITNLKGFSKDARDFMSSPKETKKIRAGALYTKSWIGYVIGSFFLKFFQEKDSPKRLFQNWNKSKDWLEKQREAIR